MALSKKEVLKLANLAKLELSEEELVTFGHQLTEVLGYVDQLKKLNLNKVDASISGVGQTALKLRLDQVKDSKPEVLKQSQQVEDDYLVAPQVFEK